MKQENKIFGILAIVLGAIALLGSWIPGINQISFLIAILALILGIVGLCINRKNKKVLAIIGTILSVASIVFAVGSQVIYNQIQKNAAQDTVSTNSSRRRIYMDQGTIRCSQTRRYSSTRSWWYKLR